MAIHAAVLQIFGLLLLLVCVTIGPIAQVPLSFFLFLRELLLLVVIAQHWVAVNYSEVIYLDRDTVHVESRIDSSNDVLLLFG